MSRGRVPYALLAAIVFAYVILRAIMVPLVHDECASVLWYVFPGEWLPDQAHGDANNHFLSTGLGVLFSALFGVHAWSLRAGSAIAFLVYAWMCWRVGALVTVRSVRWCLWAALLACPFMLDLFSLFRGYGIEMAGWMIALDGCTRYARSGTAGYFIQTLLGLVVGGTAIIALVPMWVIMLGALLLLAAVHGWKQAIASRAMFLWFILAGLVPMVCAAWLALGMKDAGLLYYGTTEGFVPVTVASLSRYVLGDHGAGIIAMIILMPVVSIVVFLRNGLRQLSLQDAGPLLLLVLLADVVARVVMARFAGVNFPEDRAGLHYVPLFLIIVALTVDRLAQHRALFRLAALPLLFLPARVFLTANLDHTLIWAEQSVPQRFAQKVVMQERALGRRAVVGGYHQLALSWPIAAQLCGTEVPLLQTVGFPEGEHDLRIVDHRFLERARQGYEAIDSAVGPDLWLLRRAHPMIITPVDTIVSAPHDGDDEFVELAHVADTLLHNGIVHLDIRTTLAIKGVSPDAGCVIEVNDSSGNKLYYDRMPLCALHRTWNGDTLHVARTLPRMKEAARAVIYLHDPERIRLVTGRGEVTMGTCR